MRPPVLPSGNFDESSVKRGVSRCFNEAAGFTQRKHGSATDPVIVGAAGFNEAAGFTQRKRRVTTTATRGGVTGFNEAAGFTQRKHPMGARTNGRPRPASMRPPVLPSGNSGSCWSWFRLAGRRFNEAAGFTQRKRDKEEAAAKRAKRASMRPPVLPSGNFEELVALAGVQRLQ